MKNETQNDQTRKKEQDKNSLGNDKTNTNAGNDGKIGKAHDQWGKDSNKKDIEKDNRVRSDKTVTEPEIDAPIYDPEKTEKKIPRMESDDKK